MSSRSFAFSTMVTTVAIASVCACAWGQGSQPSAVAPKVANEAGTKAPGKLKLLVWGTAKSEEEAQALLADYNKAKVDWEEYIEFPSDYPRFINIDQARSELRLFVLGICHEKEADLFSDLFRILHAGFRLQDIDGMDLMVNCPEPPRQRYMPHVIMIKQNDRKLRGILFKAMIADDYSLIMVLQDKDGFLLDRKDESGLCDDSRLWWGEGKTLQFTGVCVTGLGTTLGTSKVKKVFSIENDKIAVTEESEVVSTPTIHD